MVWVPAKSTSNQSGYSDAVASAQTPPVVQFRPLRSPSMAPLVGNPGPLTDDAIAVAPLAAAATFTRLVAAVVVKVEQPLVASVVPVPFRARTCHQYVAAGAATLAVVWPPTETHAPSHTVLLVTSRQYS